MGNVKKSAASILSLVAIAVLFQNCNGYKVENVSEVINPIGGNTPTGLLDPNPGCYTLNSLPQIKSGDYFTGSNWNDPNVLKVGNQYIMYASSGDFLSGDVAIYRFTTSDLSSAWQLSPTTPVFIKSAGATDWDRKSVETPSVVYFQNKYYLFYTGYSSFTDVTTYKIGYATSTDGITWTRVPNVYLEPTDPTGPPNLQFNQYTVAEPGAVVFNNKIYLYFTAVGANANVQTTLQTIGLVTSSDGINWSTPQQVLLPDQVLYPRADHWIGYSTPHGAVINGKMHLFFDVANDSSGTWTQVRLHHAVSDDGASNWTQDASATLDTSRFSWASREVRAPAVFFEGNSLHYWFAGDQGTVLSIGKGICNL